MIVWHSVPPDPGTVVALVSVAALAGRVVLDVAVRRPLRRWLERRRK